MRVFVAGGTGAIGSAYSDFNGLEYETWNGWFGWTSTDTFAVAFPDPVYNNFIQTCKHVIVRADDEYDGCP